METRAYLLAKILANKTDCQVTFLLHDEGQKESITKEGIILKPFIAQRPGLKSYPTLQGIDANIYFTFGVKNISAGIIEYCSKKNKKSVLFLTQESDLNAAYLNNTKSSNEIGVSHKNCLFCLKAATHIICQSESQKEQLLSIFNRTSTLLPNPAPQIHLENEGSQNYILWVGRSDSHVKRPQLCLEVAKACPSYKFIMVMNRSDNKIFEDIFNQKPNNLSIVEHLPHSEMTKLFSNCSLFLSTSANEGFPNVFLEAACKGKPIISLSVNPNQILTKHNCGFFAQSDLKKLVLHLNELLQNKKLYKSISQNCLKYVKENHNHSVIFKKLIPVISNNEKTTAHSLQFEFNNLQEELAEQFIIQRLKYLSTKHESLAFFPTGKHTRWLINFLKQSSAKDILNKIILIDEKLQMKELLGVPIKSPSDLKALDIDTWVYSSDVNNETLIKKGIKLLKKQPVYLYENLPNGPYRVY
ncbi:MAG: glycosyltransferase [Lentisphaeraceae bacterium]|nr:glycosyltransferase [Lentisphaeraceae bacterium]